MNWKLDFSPVTRATEKKCLHQRGSSGRSADSECSGVHIHMMGDEGAGCRMKIGTKLFRWMERRRGGNSDGLWFGNLFRCGPSSRNAKQEPPF